MLKIENLPLVHEFHLLPSFLILPKIEIKKIYHCITHEEDRNEITLSKAVWYIFKAKNDEDVIERQHRTSQSITQPTLSSIFQIIIFTFIYLLSGKENHWSNYPVSFVSKRASITLGSSVSLDTLESIETWCSWHTWKTLGGKRKIYVIQSRITWHYRLWIVCTEKFFTNIYVYNFFLVLTSNLASIYIYIYIWRTER